MVPVAYIFLFIPLLCVSFFVSIVFFIFLLLFSCSVVVVVDLLFVFFVVLWSCFDEFSVCLDFKFVLAMPKVSGVQLWISWAVRVTHCSHI